MLKERGNSGFQLSHRITEEKERGKLSDKFIHCMEQTGVALADWLYDKYIEAFLHILCDICIEDPLIFKSEYRKEDLRLEVTTLIKRVSVPLIRAALLWAHDNYYCKDHAVQEVIKILPWMSFSICDEKREGFETLAGYVERFLGFGKKGPLGNKSKKNFEVPEDIKRVKQLVFDTLNVNDY